MKLRGRWKKKFSGLLALAIFLSSMPSYGASVNFKDVPKTHWAHKHITEMASIGYLQGKGGGRFDPEGELTFMESMAAFSRLTKPSKEEKKEALNKYNKFLADLKVKQEWEKDALSMALYRGIVSENEVKNANKMDYFHKPLRKLDFAVFLAKALGLEEKADQLPVIYLDFKDVTEIDGPLRKYVKVLVDAKIIEGDDAGKFHPKQVLRRKILATMLSKSHDYLKLNPVPKPAPDKPTEPDIPKEEPKEVEPIIKETSGSLKRITREIGRDFLVIEDSKGRESSFILENDTRIIIDGKKETMAGLDEGLELDLEYDDSSRQLIRVEARSLKEEIQGALRSIDSKKESLLIEYRDKNSTRTESFDLAKNVRLERDGKTASLSSFRNGDYIRLELRNNKVVGLKASPKEIRLKGEIIKVRELKDSRDNRQEILVKDSSKDEYKILVDDKSYVYRDKAKARPDQLRVGDQVDIRAVYSLEDDYFVADDIDAKVVTEKVVGYVVEISNRLNKNPLVTIKLKDGGKEKSYELSKDAYIKVDGKTLKELPANPGYEVELYVQSDQDIVEVYADSSSMENSVVGKIDYIDSRDEYIEIEVQDFNGTINKRFLRVYIERSTIITDRSLEKLKVRDLFKGDYVNVVGVYKGANFVADTIQIR